MTQITKSGYDGAVKKIRALLTDWFESGVDLFLELKKIDQSGIWKHPGHATFSDFLRAEFPTALGFERYQNVVNAIEVYGIERVKQVGIDACHAITVKALVENKPKRDKLLDGIDNFVKKNGCAPDRNKIRELVAAVAPESRRPPKELLETNELGLLRQALAEAKARIRELEKEVRDLKKKKPTKSTPLHS